MTGFDQNLGGEGIPSSEDLRALYESSRGAALDPDETDFASASERAVLKEWTAHDFSALYTRFRPHLERHARKFLRNPSHVDEVVQDAFLYLMVTLPELDSELGVLRFLKWKVRLLALNVIATNSRASLIDIEEFHNLEADVPEPGSEIERAEDAAIVMLAMAKLQPRHREVLIASIYEEKATPEIADQVGLSENATRQLLLRARQALRKALVGDMDITDMSLGQIVSVAARKAAEEAKRSGVQAMSLLGVLLLGGLAILGNVSPMAQQPVAQVNPQTPSAEAEIEPGPLAEAAPELPTPSDPSPDQSSEPVAAVDAPPEDQATQDDLASQAPAPEYQKAGDASTMVELAAGDPLVDLSPFEPWLIDGLYEDLHTAQLLGGEESSSNLLTSNSYSAVSGSDLWADFTFDADSGTPISNVQIGFLVDSQQYFAAPSMADYLVGRTDSGLEQYVFVGEIGEIFDSSYNFYSQTRLEGTFIRLVVEIDPAIMEIVSIYLSAENSI